MMSMSLAIESTVSEFRISPITYSTFLPENSNSVSYNPFSSLLKIRTKEAPSDSDLRTISLPIEPEPPVTRIFFPFKREDMFYENN